MKTSSIPPEPSRFADKLKSARLSAGISLRCVAREIGVSPTFLSDIEHGRRMPSREVLERIAIAISVPVRELLAFDPREDLVGIAKALVAEPQMGADLLRICDLVKSGKISRDEVRHFSDR